MHNIYHDLEIKADPSSIYKSIITPEGLNSWWTLKSSGIAVLGNQFQFYFSDDYNWLAQLVHLNENNLIQFQMTHADADWTNTILTFKINRLENNISLLSFSHEGWNAINPHFRRTNFGWALYLNGLKNYVEKDIIIDYSKRDAH